MAPVFLENASHVPQSLLDDPAVRRPIVDAIPADRVGTGAEVAELVLALAGPASDFSRPGGADRGGMGYLDQEVGR